MIHATQRAAAQVCDRLNANLMSDSRYYAPKQVDGGWVCRIEHTLSTHEIDAAQDRLASLFGHDWLMGNE